jgi:hypothetical protein|tara:strand:- start:3053 stop:3673 length:621 start_codon:yes stop_codon:yes gene_type:complete
MTITQSKENDENKKMTKAFKSVQDYRDMLNSGRDKIMAEDLSSVVYLYENSQGKPCAVGYRGRARKPAFHYSYSSDEVRARRVSDWMEDLEKPKDRTEAPARGLAVDDVLRSSWGYDQTNIDFFRVTRLIGKTMVEIVEIGSISTQDGDMQGHSVPDIETVIGEPMRRKAKGTSVNVDAVRYASKIEPKKVAGCELYSPSRWTNDH